MPRLAGREPNDQRYGADRLIIVRQAAEVLHVEPDVPRPHGALAARGGRPPDGSGALRGRGGPTPVGRTLLSATDAWPRTEVWFQLRTPVNWCARARRDEEDNYGRKAKGWKRGRGDEASWLVGAQAAAQKGRARMSRPPAAHKGRARMARPARRNGADRPDRGRGVAARESPSR